MTNADLWQAIVALIWPVAQEWIKNSPVFSMFSKQTEKANAALSVLVAALSTLGFHYTGAGTSAAGWDLHFTIPPLATLQHALLAWIAGHVAYKTYVKNPATQTKIAAHLGAIRMMTQPVVYHRVVAAPIADSEAYHPIGQGPGIPPQGGSGIPAVDSEPEISKA